MRGGSEGQAVGPYCERQVLRQVEKDRDGERLAITISFGRR